MRRLLARTIGGLGVVLAFRASAQSAPGPHFPRPTVVTSQPPPSERPGSLEAHLALSVAERLLASDDSDDRVRGVERLAASGQREAIDRLSRALGDGASSLRDPRARLAAVRGLFPFGARETVRQALRKVLEGEVGASPILSLVRDTAALGLAASNDARSLEVLNTAIRQGGTVGDAAERALLAYPPASLAPLGVGHEELPATVCDLLGKLGDQRAIGALRGTLVRGLVRGDAPSDVDPEVDSSPEDQSRRAKFAAALALARLGDHEQVAVARSWLASGDDGYRLRGAEVLLLSGVSDARRVLVPLLSAPSTRGPAFALAARSPGLELLGVLGDAAKTPDDAGRIAVALLGRLGGATAVTRLEALMRDPARAWEAAFALSRAPGDEARSALDRALSSSGKTGGVARLAARASVVRVLSTGDEPRALDETLRSLFASKDPADRAAGAFGLAALGKMSASELAASQDPAIVRAAARAVLVLGPESAVAFGRRLAAESDRTTRTALALALARSTESFDAVPTYELLAWAESDEPIAPLAIVALGSREEPGDERRIARWLESDNPVIRAHAALALASSPLANATGRLADAWRYEPDPVVRRAIVDALAQRKEPARFGALRAAETLDPDAGVREAAALARSGLLPSPIARTGRGCRGAGAGIGACYVAWINLVPSAASQPETVRARVGSLVDASGLSLPVVSDPDGALVVPGVSSGDASFRLASSGVWYDALGHDRSQTGSAR